jgi:hypothetical protein
MSVWQIGLIVAAAGAILGAGMGWGYARRRGAIRLAQLEGEAQAQRSALH